MKGRFLVLEGIDGCGKSSQIQFLYKWLPTSGLLSENAKLIVTREPGGTSLGASLRELLLRPPNDISPEPLAELLLYAADRAQHVSQVIQPALDQGHWVISDRFSGSTLAYQGYGRNLNLDIIRQLESIATEGLIPDTTLWLDLSVKTSLSRREEIANDRIEAEGEVFLAKVAEGFSLLSKQRNWVRIDANQILTKVSHDIENELIKNFGTHN